MHLPLSPSSDFTAASILYQHHAAYSMKRDPAPIIFFPSTQCLPVLLQSNPFCCPLQAIGTTTHRWRSVQDFAAGTVHQPAGESDYFCSLVLTGAYTHKGVFTIHGLIPSMYSGNSLFRNLNVLSRIFFNNSRSSSSFSSCSSISSMS